MKSLFKSWIFWLALIAVVIVIGYLMWSNYNQPAIPETADDKAPASTDVTNGSQATPDAMSLQPAPTGGRINTQKAVNTSHP